MYYGNGIMCTSPIPWYSTDIPLFAWVTYFVWRCHRKPVASYIMCNLKSTLTHCVSSLYAKSNIIACIIMIIDMWTNHNVPSILLSVDYQKPAFPRNRKLRGLNRIVFSWNVSPKITMLYLLFSVVFLKPAFLQTMWRCDMFGVQIKTIR